MPRTIDDPAPHGGEEAWTAPSILPYHMLLLEMLGEDEAAWAKALDAEAAYEMATEGLGPVAAFDMALVALVKKAMGLYARLPAHARKQYE